MMSKHVPLFYPEVAVTNCLHSIHSPPTKVWERATKASCNNAIKPSLLYFAMRTLSPKLRVLLRKILRRCTRGKSYLSRLGTLIP